MLGCSLNLFMMLSILSSFFYFANARVFLEYINDVKDMVLFLLVCECSGVPWIYLWCWVCGPLSFILQMLGCSFNLFMMLSIWSSIFYFANARVFLEYINDVKDMVLFLLVCECSGVPSIYLWWWEYGPLSFILQMLGSSLNLFVMLTIWSSILYFANGRVFLEFIYDVEYMVLFLLVCEC